MATPLQNRLVGAVVLTALGVIFLPELLDGKKATVEENFATIPLRPVVEPARIPDNAFEPIEQAVPVAPEEEPTADPVVPEGTRGSDVAPIAKAGDRVAEKEKSQVKDEPPVAKPTAKPAPKPVRGGWAIRLGSFRDAGNVARLLEQLRSKGYTAYTVPRQPVSGQLTVVYVGPEIEKARAESMQQRLATQLGLKGQLKKYDPIKM